MKAKNMSMFFISALVAIAGAVGYPYFVKQVPTSINPIVSGIGMYVVVLIISIFLLPFTPVKVDCEPISNSLAGLKSH